MPTPSHDHDPECSPEERQERRKLSTSTRHLASLCCTSCLGLDFPLRINFYLRKEDQTRKTFYHTNKEPIFLMLPTTTPITSHVEFW